jgi:hypothetical protein
LHKPSNFRDRSDEELDEIVKSITGKAVCSHGEIMAGVRARMDTKSTNDGLDEMSLRQGFSFDVLFDEATQRCVLIELNVFGARSGCGAYLFHWLRDVDVLDGRRVASEGVPDVEFRTSI